MAKAKQRGYHSADQVKPGDGACWRVPGGPGGCRARDPERFGGRRDPVVVRAALGPAAIFGPRPR